MGGECPAPTPRYIKTSDRSILLGAWESIHAVDRLDLHAFDLRNVRAILFPDSDSATHSVNLRENRPITSLTTVNECLLSPLTSASEVEGGMAKGSPSRNTFKNRTRTTKPKRNRSRVIVLEQSRDDEKFTFGLGPQNDVILKHRGREARKFCYINCMHLQLYPNPDHDALTIYNTSTSDFSAHSFATSQVRHIGPNQGAILDCGSWRLGLGKGLDFQIRILPRTHGEIHHGWLPISFDTSALTTKSLRRSLRIERSKMKPPEAKPVSFSSNRGPKKTPASQVSSVPAPQETSDSPFSLNPASQETSVLQSASNSALQETLFSAFSSSSVSQETQVLQKTICEKEGTKVFKVIRNEVAVAVKTCRKPTTKSSADMWRNELEILRDLHHPSVIRLLRYNAWDLSLELEYIGPDLAKFVDKLGMSQLSENARYRIWMDISGGIEYIHAQHIVHLDIKPSNILLGEGDRGVVLCDFGLSFKASAQSRPNNGGTPSYIPPEYLLHKGSGSFAGDIWAFGVTMLFAFSLLPLPTGNWWIAEVLRDEKIHKKMVNWLHVIRQAKEKIPWALSLLRPMLEDNPEQRITAAGLVSGLSATEHHLLCQ